MLHGRTGCLLSFPPKEIWTDEILPRVGFGTYLAQPEGSAESGSWTRTLTAATRSLTALTGSDRGSLGNEAHQAMEEDGDGSSSDGGDSDGTDIEDTMSEASEADALLPAPHAAPHSSVTSLSANTNGHPHPPPPPPPVSQEILSRILQLLAQATSLGSQSAAARPSGADGTDAPPAPGGVPHRSPPVSQLW
jgi:hypothetical protein